MGKNGKLSFATIRTGSELYVKKQQALGNEKTRGFKRKKTDTNEASNVDDDCSAGNSAASEETVSEH